MVDLLKTEYYKLFHSNGFWGMSVFSLMLGSVLLLDSHRMTSGLLNASLYNTPMLFFLTIIFATLFIGEDFYNKTLHLYVSAGHKRSRILFAKTVVYLTACAAILVLPLCVHGLLGTAMQGHGSFSGKSFLMEAAVILVSVLSMCMLPLFCALFFKDIGKTLAVPMVLYFLMIYALNGEHSKVMSVVLPMGQMRLLSQNALPVSAAVMIGMDTLWILVLYLGALLVFCRCDLK